MPTDARTAVLQRIAYIQAELNALQALVSLSFSEGYAPAEAAAPAAAAPAAPPVEEEEELPPEPEGLPTDLSEFTIDPVQAAQILGVARQTVDRRLKQNRRVPGAPINVSRGTERARWRWRSEDDVRQWWEAVKR